MNLKEYKASTSEEFRGEKEKGGNDIIAFYFQKYSLKVFLEKIETQMSARFSAESHSPLVMVQLIGRIISVHWFACSRNVNIC